MLNKIKAKIKSLFEVKRYYIISYLYANKAGQNGYGQINWTTINNKYINKKSLENHLLKEYNFTNVIILNVLTLTKSQFKFWNKDE
jgi:glycine cleavage system protein P-like pyridoxal-binding family